VIVSVRKAPLPLIRITNAGGTQLWGSGQYGYDGAGNIKQIGSTSYRYDPYQRLTGWTLNSSGGGYTDTYRSYDSFGNFLSSGYRGCGAALNGLMNCFTTSVLANEVVGTTNRYKTQTHDLMGNIVSDFERSFSYDATGAMTGSQIGPSDSARTFRFLYSADNERVALVERVSVSNGVVRNRTNWTLRGFNDKLLSSWTDDSTSGTRTISWTEDEIWRGGLLLANESSLGTRHYSLDHLGSPRLVTDASGQVVGTQNFEPFGGGGSRDGGYLQFTGHERDSAKVGGESPSNLPDYFHARYYAPMFGRFLSVDPVMEATRAVKVPQLWNRYAYALSNPINRVDPDGRTDACVTCRNAEEEATVRAQAARGNEFAMMRLGQTPPGIELVEGPLGLINALPREGVSLLGVVLIGGIKGAIRESGELAVRSLIKNDSLLVAAAQAAGKSHQSSINNLVRELAKGNLNPGIGTKNLFSNVYYARARDGARVFFRQSADGAIEILGKASKANEAKVIKRLEELYR